MFDRRPALCSSRICRLHNHKLACSLKAFPKEYLLEANRQLENCNSSCNQPFPKEYSALYTILIVPVCLRMTCFLVTLSHIGSKSCFQCTQTSFALHVCITQTFFVDLALKASNRAFEGCGFESRSKHPTFAFFSTDPTFEPPPPSSSPPDHASQHTQALPMAWGRSQGGSLGVREVKESHSRE